MYHLSAQGIDERMINVHYYYYYYYYGVNGSKSHCYIAQHSFWLLSFRSHDMYCDIRLMLCCYSICIKRTSLIESFTFFYPSVHSVINSKTFSSQNISVKQHCPSPLSVCTICVIIVVSITINLVIVTSFNYSCSLSVIRHLNFVLW